MTDYDRGEFVKDRTITIEPCANGTFMIRWGWGERQNFTFPTNEFMAFSSASDMMRFLNKEYTIQEPFQQHDIEQSQSIRYPNTNRPKE